MFFSTISGHNRISSTRFRALRATVADARQSQSYDSEKATKEALVELDLRAKKGGPAVPTKVTDGSSTLPARSTLDDLRATPGPGFVFVSGRLFVRTTGGELHVE